MRKDNKASVNVKMEGEEDLSLDDHSLKRFHEGDSAEESYEVKPEPPADFGGDSDDEDTDGLEDAGETARLSLGMFRYLKIYKKGPTVPKVTPVKFDLKSSDVEMLQKQLRFCLKKYKELYQNNMAKISQTTDLYFQNQKLKEEIERLKGLPYKSSQYKEISELKTSLETKSVLLEKSESSNVVLKREVEEEKRQHERFRTMLEAEQKRNEALTILTKELKHASEEDKKASKELQSRYNEAKETMERQRIKFLELTMDCEAKYVAALEKLHDISKHDTGEVGTSKSSTGSDTDVILEEQEQHLGQRKMSKSGNKKRKGGATNNTSQLEQSGTKKKKRSERRSK